MSTADFAIAYDVPTLEEALALDARLGQGPEYAKLGLELFAAEGPALVEAVVDPFEPPQPARATFTQALHMAESLARGEPRQHAVEVRQGGR